MNECVCLCVAPEEACPMRFASHNMDGASFFGRIVSLCWTLEFFSTSPQLFLLGAGCLSSSSNVLIRAPTSDLEAASEPSGAFAKDLVLKKQPWSLRKGRRQRPARARSPLHQRTFPTAKVPTGRSASKSVHTPLDSSKPKLLRQLHPRRVAHGWCPSPPPLFLPIYQRLPALPPRIYQQVSNSNRLSPQELFRSRAFFDPSNRQSRPPPPEHGNFFHGMHVAVLPHTTCFDSHHGYARKLWQNFAAAQHKQDRALTFASGCRVMASFDPRSDGRSWRNGRLIRREGGSKRTCGMQRGSG